MEEKNIVPSLNEQIYPDKKTLSEAVPSRATVRCQAKILTCLRRLNTPAKTSVFDRVFFWRTNLKVFIGQIHFYKMSTV